MSYFITNHYLINAFFKDKNPGNEKNHRMHNLINKTNTDVNDKPTL